MKDTELAQELGLGLGLGIGLVDDTCHDDPEPPKDGLVFEDAISEFLYYEYDNVYALYTDLLSLQVYPLVNIGWEEFIELMTDIVLHGSSSIKLQVVYKDSCSLVKRNIDSFLHRHKKEIAPYNIVYIHE